MSESAIILLIDGKLGEHNFHLILVFEYNVERKKYLANGFILNPESLNQLICRFFKINFNNLKCG